MSIDTKKVREQLVAKLAELQTDADSQTEAYPTPVGDIEAKDGPNDFEEVAVDANEMQQEQAILANDQALMQEIKDALKRLDDGTYGRCIDCGQAIPEKRLEAIPWAARCMKDEEALEQRNLESRRALQR